MLTAYGRLPAPLGQVEEPSRCCSSTSASGVRVLFPECQRVTHESAVHEFLYPPKGRGTLTLPEDLQRKIPPLTA